MNTELLLRVKQHILEEPARLRMSEFLVTRESLTHVDGEEFVFYDGYSIGEPRRQKIPACGTVGCIAGWAVVLSKEKPRDNFDVEITAVRLLGIDGPEADRLFYLDNWPDDLRESYELAGSAEERAKIAGERIDRFIETGK